jgi:hypothetical protein
MRFFMLFILFEVFGKFGKVFVHTCSDIESEQLESLLKS